MARNNRSSYSTNLFYITEGKLDDGYFSEPQFPYLQWHGDTWRKKVFFNEFMREYNNGDEKAYMHVLKKVWCEHNTVCRGKKRKMLTLDILLDKCFDNCPCCDSKLWYGRCFNSIEEVKSRDSKPSIDKIDPNGEYTDANTWIICTTCNTYKNNAIHPDRLQQVIDGWNKALKNKAIFEKEEMRGPLDNF